jgi:hypothetical protein
VRACSRQNLQGGNAGASKLARHDGFEMFGVFGIFGS